MIVFCHLLNDRSGSPMVLRDTLDALHAHRDGVLYIGSQGRGVLDEANVPTRRYWYRRSQFRILTFFTFIASQILLYRALAKAHDIPKDAVLYVNTLLPFGAMLWGRLNGRRVIVHVHEISITPSLLRRVLTACAAHCADRLLYVSDDHQMRLPIHGPPKSIVANPVNPRLSDVAEHISYSPRRSGAFEVLMLASLRTYKGIDEFIALATALRDRHDLRFTLVLNADKAEVNALAASFPCAHNVALHPRTDNPAAFYSTADLVLNLARVDQWIETFGLTLVEAMTFGVPVIAPSIGGPTNIVTHGREGFCIDSRDGDALKAAILALADDPRKALAMSQAARRRAKDFTFENYAAQLGRIVADVKANTGRDL